MVHVKDIPKATRWIMATHVLTRLVVALGQEQGSNADISSFREMLFSEMAYEIRSIADLYGMPREHAANLVQTLGAVSVILFGPKFETRFIEGYPEEAVIRLTECAMFREKCAHGISPSQVNMVCTAYLQHAIESLNPEFTLTMSRSRCSGDEFCEMIIERRNP